MRPVVLFLVLLINPFTLFSQVDTVSVMVEKKEEQKEKRIKVYNTKPIINVPIIAGGFVSNYFGIKKLKSKPGLDSAVAVMLSPDQLHWFDRSAAMQNPAIAKRSMLYSDIALNTAIISPLILLFDDEIKRDALQIGVIYLTTEAIMANAYSWGVGHLNRMRPYVYNPRESIERRTRMGSFNSFYGGHVAAAASCGFFVAKVYSDYHPDMKNRGLLFTAAAIPSAVVFYFRHKAGMHFPSDNIAGMAGGAFLGFIVPHLHKNRKLNKDISLIPSFNGDHAGFTLKVEFDGKDY